MDASTQHDFRKYISQQIQKHADAHGKVKAPTDLSPCQSTAELRQSLEQILLLVRKLREALVASRSATSEFDGLDLEGEHRLRQSVSSG
jgi:hypothetical protein